MGAWSKLFSDSSRGKSTFSVKCLDGVTRSFTPVHSAKDMSDAAFAEAAANGAAFTEKLPAVNDRGEKTSKSKTFKPEETAPKEALAVACDLMGIDMPGPKSKKNVDAVPSENGTTTVPAK